MLLALLLLACSSAEAADQSVSLSDGEHPNRQALSNRGTLRADPETMSSSGFSVAGKLPVGYSSNASILLITPRLAESSPRVLHEQCLACSHGI